MYRFLWRGLAAVVLKGIAGLWYAEATRIRAWAWIDELAYRPVEEVELDQYERQQKRSAAAFHISEPGTLRTDRVLPDNGLR